MEPAPSSPPIQGRPSRGNASPPMPSKGAYNIDFDNLDDSAFPSSSNKGIANSPVAGAKSGQGGLVMTSGNNELPPEQAEVVDPNANKPLADRINAKVRGLGNDLSNCR